MSDFRLAVRSFRRSPGPTAVIVGTLALAVAAATIVYSTIDIVYHLLPIADRDRMVFIASVDSRRSESMRLGLSVADLVDVTEQASTLEAIAAFSLDSATLTDVAEPVRVSIVRATSNLPVVWGLEAVLGRAIQPQDGRPGAQKVAVLTYTHWQRQFGANPSVAGTSVLLNDEPHTIVGVLPEAASVGAWRDRDILVVLPLDGGASGGRAERDVWVTGRLKEGVAREAAAADIDAVARRLQSAYPATNTGVRLQVLPLIELSGMNVRILVFILALIALLVVAMACANVANIVLAQAMARRQERAIRAALGASWPQQIRQALVESLIASVVAGGGGVLVAAWGLAGLRWFAGAETVAFSDLTLNSRILVGSLVTSLIAPLLFALLPAIRLSSANHTDLREAGRSNISTGRGTAPKFIVAGQVALAMILLVQVGVLGRAAWNLSARSSSGFDARQVLTFRIDLPAAKYAQPEARNRFFQSLLARMGATPGVVAAGATDRLPVADDEPTLPLRVEGDVRPVAELPLAARTVIAARYFGALRIPLLAGRELTAAEVDDDSAVAVVSEETARRLWPGQAPLGRRIGFASAAGVERWLTVVGVVGNIRNADLDQPPLPHVYVPAGNPPSAMAFVVRSEGEDPLALVSAVRSDVTRLDPNQPVHDVASMSQIIFDDSVGTYVLMVLLGGTAFLALCLAAAGIYGVVSYAVTRHTREIGVRMALGATPGSVQRAIVWQGSIPALIGTAIGLAAAIVIAFITAGSVPEMDVRDPTSYSVVVVSLALVVLVASYLPARRASLIDPAITLRVE